MKKALLTLLTLVILSVMGLALFGEKMQKISTEIIINAPKEKVWAHLAEINKWSEWSPIINGSAGQASLGSQLKITMTGKDGADGPKYDPIITELEESKVLRWRAKMGAEFLFANDKVLSLEEVEGGTKLTHTEEFRGILVSIFCGKMEEGVPPMLNSMNEALKKLVENN